MKNAPTGKPALPERGTDRVAEVAWQLVLVLWGDKYPVREVNHLIDTSQAHAKPAPARIILLTDRPRPGLRDEVDARDMPAFFLNPDFLRGGCQAKLCMFEKGMVPDDLPALFVDIDTVVLGNLSQHVHLMQDRQTVAILQIANLPFGALARWLYRRTGGRRYSRGNSSVVVYHPAECTHIAARFRELFARHGSDGFRPMIADERFISWVNQPNMRAIPRDMAVKLPTEFMLPWRWLILLRARLPWVRARWDRLIVVTLPGVEVKGDALLALPEGAEIIDRKGRRLIWSEAALGPIKARLTDYYRSLDRKGEAS